MNRLENWIVSGGEEVKGGLYEGNFRCGAGKES